MSRIKYYPNWIKTIVKNYSSKDRVQRVEKTLDHISKFKDGKSSEEGKELKKFLEEHCEFIGFIPNVTYVKDKGSKADLESMFVHSFAQMTLLYKVKDKPMLIVTNSSIMLDDSVLNRIDGNESIDELQDILGITG